MSDDGKALVIHVNEMDRYPDAVYIGGAVPRRRMRASPFANPFRITRPSDLGPGITRHMACLMFRDYLRSSERGRTVLARLPELRGKPLACWCRRSDCSPGAFKPCHGDQIVRLLNDHSDAELRAMAGIAGANASDDDEGGER